MIEQLGIGDNFLGVGPAKMKQLIDQLNELGSLDAGEGIEIVRGGGMTTIRLARNRSEVAGGGGDDADPGYRGYFKVIDVPTVDGSPATQIKIVDGARPSYAYCGDTDIYTSVPVATIAKVNRGSVWIVASRNSGGYITISFTTNAPTSGVGYVKIADITDGTIRQLWLNNRIVFRSEFLI